MPHAKSLRAIGQSLESLGIVAFVMQRNGLNYVVHSDALPDVSALNLKESLSEKVWDFPTSSRKGVQLVEVDNALHYAPNYVSWLDAQGRKRRRKRFSAQATGSMKASQLLRTVGRHIDRLEPHTFTISWSSDAVTIDYELADGQHLREVLSMAKVHELTVRTRFQRARRR
ncbi:MAG TPA: hypothetical protein VF977_06265 [Candidatus Binatia bacterium]